MFKLRKLLSPKKPKEPEIEGDKQQEQGIQYSKTYFKENVNDKGKESFSSQNVENVLSDRKEMSMEKVKTGGSDGEDQSIQERKEESEESIAKSKKYHPEDVCDIDTCSKQECTPDTCNRLVDKEALDDNEIDTSKLTEIINSTIKETVKTMIKQCAMDTGRVTSPVPKESQERSKITVCRNKTELGEVIEDDNDKYLSRKRYYPCDYLGKYEKRPCPIKAIRKCNVKGSYDDSIISKCRPGKEFRPEKDNVRCKDTKKRSKTSRNVKTDNRRMTGNVNIYICSEANENAQRKEKEKKDKSESCTESSSETTTERTNSSCVRTSSVSSNKLVSGIQKRRQKLQEVGSNDYFHSRENRVGRCNDEDAICYEKYEKESCMTLKQDDRLDLSTLSSGSTEIDSATSSISSTREGCRCRETVSSRLKMHRRELSSFKPKFLTYDDETTSRIFSKCSDHGEIDDNWIQRSVCVDKPSFHPSIEASRCCCKKNIECKRKSVLEKKSSFDILHKKLSKCSCIVEEEEEDQYVVCPKKSVDVKREDLEDVTICPSFANSKEPKEISNKNGNITENLNEQKSAGKIYEYTKEKKNESSKTIDIPMPKISLVLKKSRLNTASGKSKMAIVPKLQQSNRNIKNAAETSAKRNTKEKIEVKAERDKDLSQDKLKNSFFGRSVKKAISLVKQEKMQQDKNTKNNEENSQRKTNQTVNQPKMVKPDRNNKLDSEKFSKIDRDAPKISKQDNPIPDRTKVTGNENTSRIDPNKRGKSKLQTILASRRTVQPIKADSTDLNKSNRPEVTNERENIKEGISDPEKEALTERVPSTKITFEESKQQEAVDTNDCPCEKKSFESTINRCCCCCQPVIDCTCEVKKTSTVCVIPKVVVEDVSPVKCNCCRPLDDCECDKPVICGDCSGSTKVYRYDVFCLECNKPKEKCHCGPTYVDCRNSNYQYRRKETIICVYCELPRDKCVCRAPIRKCSCCGLSFDVCKCCKIYDGRPIVTDHDGDRKICVTAWKPKPEVKRYFSRNFNNRRSDAIDECYCRKSHKNYGYEDLPYQRSNAFSDVMCELQQKMSDSVCCERCKRNPCCCRRNFDKSTKPRQRSRSPEFCPIRNVPRRTLPLSRVCYSCKASPCRCRKGRTTTMTKKPRAKCYYCKSSPCTCICAREVNKSRSCKCGDSPCRVKEKETVLRGKSFDDSRKKNDEKVSRARDSDTCVCPLTKPY